MAFGFRLRKLAQKFLGQMLISTAKVCAKLASQISQFQRHLFTWHPCAFSDMKFILHGSRKETVAFGGPKREFAWQVQGIRRVSEIAVGAGFCGCCQKVGRRDSFEGLYFTWQAQ